MATGIIGTLGSSTSLTYSPLWDAKVLITATCGSQAGTLSVNGVLALSVAANTNASMTVYVGQGQSVTVATANGVSAIVSALEEM